MLRIRTVVAAVVAAALIAGCAKDGGPVAPPDNGNNGGNNGGGIVNAEQRRAATDSIVAFAQTLTGTPVSNNQQLAAFARRVAVIEDAGVEGGNAWARFRDGKLLLIGGFRPTLEGGAPEQGVRNNRPPSRTGATGANLSTTGSPSLNYDTPITNQIRLLNSLGPAFDPIWFGDGFTSTIQDLKEWFTRDVGGYQMPAADRAEVSDLKGVWGDGVFYMSAHGAKGRLRDGSGLYGLWTSTPVTPANDLLYQTDLDSGYLCIYAAIHDRAPIPTPGRGVYTTHYAITPKFVRRYMSFTTNSFVFINACLSDDADFKQAFLDKGASEYAGWSNYADPTSAIKTARYLFDRMLGVNKAQPRESIPQRPFGLNFVLTDMAAKGLDKASTADHGLCELKVAHFGSNGFNFLAPSIVAVNAFDMIREIHIAGTFGSDPGNGAEVLVGGTALRIKSWRHDRIICEAPMQGAGSVGDVQVKIRGRKSNVFQLTEWRGTFNYVLAGRGTLKVEVTLNVHFRGSLNLYRLAPGGTPEIGSLRPITLLETTSGSYQASGMYVSPGGSIETWTGGGGIPLITDITHSRGFSMPGSFIDLAARRADIALQLNDIKYTSNVNGSSLDIPLTIVMTGLRFQLDAQHRIVGGTHTVPLGNHSATLTWGTIQPIHPPTSDYAR